MFPLRCGLSLHPVPALFPISLRVCLDPHISALIAYSERLVTSETIEGKSPQFSFQLFTWNLSVCEPVRDGD